MNHTKATGKSDTPLERMNRAQLISMLRDQGKMLTELIEKQQPTDGAQPPPYEEMLKEREARISALDLKVKEMDRWSNAAVQSIAINERLSTTLDHVAKMGAVLSDITSALVNKPKAA